MQLERVLAQPAAPLGVIRSAGRDERPERAPVSEHAKMGELVDNDGIEGLRWRKHQSPGEGQAPAA